MLYKKYLLTITIFFACNFTSYADGYKSTWASIGSGGGAASGGDYSSDSIIGQVTVGKSTETSTYLRNYAGFAPGSISIQDAKITFYNARPKESTVSESLEVTCKITIKAFNNDIDTTTVKYQISNSGISGFSNVWHDGANIANQISDSEIQYTVTIPTSSTGESFSGGSNNYIRWRAFDTGANTEISGAYKVKIKEPELTIIQPVDYSSAKPVFEIEVEGGINTNTITLDIDKKSGADVIEVSGSDNYVSAENVYRYNYTGSKFIEGETYTLTVTASDGSGNSYTDTSEFIVNKGMIADLIPYPSPFDPNAEGVKIRYVLQEQSDVSIRIYNTSGELVLSLIEEEIRSAGMNEGDIWYAKNFAGSRLANGVYVCEVIAEDQSGKEHRRYTSLAILRR